MSDYSDLVKRQREIAEASYKMRDAIEADFHKQADMNGRLLTKNAELRQRIAELEASIDKNDEWAKGFIEKTDARIAELEAALKPFADASEVHLGSDDMSIAFRIIIGNLRQARKVLGEK